MKRFVGLIVLLFMLSGCTPGKAPLPATPSAPPPTQTITFTPTAVATSTATATPIPTLVLPVTIQTSVPISHQQISSENIKNLREIARYFGSGDFAAALTRDHSRLFVGDPRGIDVYDYETKKPLYHIDVHDAYELQVSTHGDWLLVNQNWLVRMNATDMPRVYNLRSDLNLTYGEASLSPDGSKIALSEGVCFENCPGIFQIINLPDFRILYSWNDGTYKSMHGYDATFSSDGSLVATRVDNNIIFWHLPDGAQVARIKNIQGRSHFILSDDSLTVAIGQIDAVQIWNIASQQMVQIIRGLCGEMQDPPQPFYVDAKQVAVLECPYTQEGRFSAWAINDASVLANRRFVNVAISRVVYDGDNASLTVLQNPQKVGPWTVANQPDSIEYLDDGALTFRYRDEQWRDVTCIVSVVGQAECLESVVLGTDQQFYTYTTSNNMIEFHKGFGNPGSQIAYSLARWKGRTVDALDPVNGLVFYTIPTGMHSDSSNVQDLGSGQSMGAWPSSYMQGVAFSGNKKVAAFCRKAHNGPISNSAGIDKLTIMDLSQRVVINQLPFTCYVPMILSDDGSKFISIDTSTVTVGGYLQFLYRLLVMNTSPPAEQKTFEIGCQRPTALAISTDGSVLAMACDDETLRFLDPYSGSEIYRLTNTDSDVWGLAFSKDGGRLASISKRGVISIWAVPPFSSSP